MAEGMGTRSQRRVYAEETVNPETGAKHLLGARHHPQVSKTVTQAGQPLPSGACTPDNPLNKKMTQRRQLIHKAASAGTKSYGRK